MHEADWAEYKAETLYDLVTDDASREEFIKVVAKELRETHEAGVHTGAGDERREVRWFAERMERKLKKNDYKGHWRNSTFGYLRERLDQECRELHRLFKGRFGTPKYTPIEAEKIVSEAADVGNFAMMIADNVKEFLAKEGS